MTSPTPLAAGATVADVGEFGLVREFAHRFDQGEKVYVGPGDDAAVVRAPRGHVVVSTDLLVEGRHFRREWASARDIGRRAAAQNLSDINAMGGRATALTVGLALPRDLPAQWVLDLADGLAEEAALVGASIVGGDLTAGSEVVVAVTVIGECSVAPVLRSGARPGDVLAIAGRQGWAAAGLAVLGRGFRSPRKLVEAHQRPEPPYEAGSHQDPGGCSSAGCERISSSSIVLIRASRSPVTAFRSSSIVGCKASPTVMPTVLCRPKSRGFPLVRKRWVPHRVTGINGAPASAAIRAAPVFSGCNSKLCEIVPSGKIPTSSPSRR